MKASSCVLLATLSSAAAWWDEGHTLCGEIATQLMQPDDVKLVNTVLHKWDDEFPNTGDITTAAMWPDLVKCNSQSSTYCPSPLKPSVSMMDNWHYVNFPMNVNGSDWHGLTSKDVDALVKASFDGLALDIMSKALTTMATTQSTWAANFVLRYFIHAFTDIHQPMHTVTGISDALPQGDIGGNKYAFAKPCGSSNLHALWDSVAGTRTTNWTPDMVPGSPGRTALSQNATELIARFRANATANGVLDYQKYLDLPYAEFSKTMAKTVIPATLADSYDVARHHVYTSLDLKFDAANKVPCPSPAYQANVVQVAERQMYVGGSRLAVVLTQFARQIKALKLATLDAC